MRAPLVIRARSGKARAIPPSRHPAIPPSRFFDFDFGPAEVCPTCPETRDESARAGPEFSGAPRGLWPLDFGLWTLDFGLWTLDFGIWTFGC